MLVLMQKILINDGILTLLSTSLGVYYDFCNCTAIYLSAEHFLIHVFFLSVSRCCDVKSLSLKSASTCDKKSLHLPKIHKS